MANREVPSSYLATTELMQFLKIKHKQTIYNLIRQGMPFALSGREYRFDKSAVIAFLKLTSQKQLKRR